MAGRTKATSTDYEHPYRPWLIRAVNAIGSRGEHESPYRLSVGAMIDQARRRTGLRDLGDECFVEPLQRLVASINEEARLSVVGQLLQRIRLVGLLCTRLRVQDLLSRHPEIHQQRIGKVVLITGLQRTGTTTLHRLIDSHPEIRGTYSWETLNPVPLPKEDPGDPSRRLSLARLTQQTISFLSPDFAAIHPIAFDAPEEDVILLDLCFLSQSAEATMHVPSYSKWLETQDQTPAYAYFRTILKILQWQLPTKYWVLKSPHHMDCIATVLQEFPEATVVQTHRDPRKTLSSFCSMVAHAFGIFSDYVEPHLIAQHWTRKVQRMIEVAAKVRSQSDSDRFVDVSYYQLVSDPLSSLEQIYEHTGIAFDEDARAAAKHLSMRNAQHRFGYHQYDMEKFGLTAEFIDEAFADYRAMHHLPVE